MIFIIFHNLFTLPMIHVCLIFSKACDTDLRLKLKKEENVEKRLNRTKFVRYLIIKFNENLS